MATRAASAKMLPHTRPPHLEEGSMKSLAVFLVLLTANIASAQTAPTTATTPRGVIDQVMKDALAVLRDANLTTQQKQQKVRAIADEHIDFETMSRLSMGRYWRDLNENQRKQFVKEFTDHASATHGHIIDEYVDEDVEITGDRQEERGDWTVQTRIVANKDGRR